MRASYPLRCGWVSFGDLVQVVEVPSLRWQEQEAQGLWCPHALLDVALRFAHVVDGGGVDEEGNEGE